MEHDGKLPVSHSFTNAIFQHCDSFRQLNQLINLDLQLRDTAAILHRGIGKPEILSKRLRLRHHPFLRLTPQAPIQTNTWFDLICKPTLTLWGELHQIGVCRKRIQYDTIQPKMIKHGYVNPENDEKPLKFTGTPCWCFDNPKWQLSELHATKRITSWVSAHQSRWF